MSTSTVVPRRETRQITQPMQVCIASIGHSGSTLLGMLLDQYSQVTSVGELKNLAHYAADESLHCACGVPVSQCSLWQGVEERLRNHPKFPGLKLKDVYCDRTLPENAVRRKPTVSEFLLVLGSRTVWKLASHVFQDVRMKRAFGEQAVAVCEAVAAEQQTPFIVDSPTTATYMKVVYFAAPERFRAIEIVRDGRGWCYSLMRRENVTIEFAASLWTRRQKNMNLALRTVPDARKLRITYEDLCRATRETMSRIEQFLGLPPETPGDELKKGAFHGVGGNPMRFRHDEKSVRLDEAWRKALTAEDLKAFNRITGGLNERLGFND